MACPPSPFFLFISLSLSFCCCCCCCLHIQVCVCVPFLIKHSKCHPRGRQLIDVSVGERGRTVHSYQQLLVAFDDSCRGLTPVYHHTHILFGYVFPFQSVYLFIYSGALFVFGKGRETCEVYLMSDIDGVCYPLDV